MRGFIKFILFSLIFVALLFIYRLFSLQYGLLRNANSADLSTIESTTKFVGARYLGHHVLHAAFAPDIEVRLAKDIDCYIRFVTK